jgi:hypothetical protein
MIEYPEELTLAGPPGEWEVTLVSGEVIELLACAYSKEGDEYVFTLLIEAQPRYEIPAVKIPANIVREIQGG